MTPLDALAPDQRAVLELLLRQGRSYGDLSDLLAIPEEAVRERAHAALAGLAPGHAPPEGAANGIADWLLGQQDAATAKRTRSALTRRPEAREWAAAVAEGLRGVEGAKVPKVPAAAKPKAAAPEPTAAGEPAPAPSKPAADESAAKPAPRPRPLREGAQPAPGRPRPVRDEGAPAPASARPRSSRLGGAILIGVLALLVGGALFLLLRGDDEGGGGQTAAEQTATPSATPQVVSEVVLEGAGGSRAQGLMRVFRREEDGRLVFALAAERVPQNRGREVYAVWFTKKGGPARNLGFSQTQVGEDGVFTTGGPQQGQEDEFPRWLVDYDTIVVARATDANAKRPGKAILRGTLPGGEQ
jgi:hypothetical protein